MALVKENYDDFGPTLAAEMLAEHHGFKVSRETLRKWMIEDGRDRILPPLLWPSIAPPFTLALSKLKQINR